MKMLSLSAALALASLLPGVAQATLDLPLLYSRGAVLQRERPIHVWGWDTPGTKVRLDFDGKQANAVTDAQGRWQATLPAHAAGGPYVLEVDDGHEHRRIGDVLVGDVWLCSGQSNMEFMVSQGRDAEAEQARGDDPSIRQFKIPHSSAIRPQRQLQGGNWVAANPSTVGQFSAVCWFFARDMQARTHVPQGLINSSWGGSAIEAWTDAQTGHFDVAAVAAKKQADDAADAVGNARTYKRIAHWPALHADVKAADGSLAWAAEKLDVSDWDSLPVPSDWEPVGYYDMDGVAWYRRQFTLSAAEAAQGVTLGLGRIDDSDQSFVNGHPVGHMDLAWNTPRIYKVPAADLHAGNNSIAVRVDDLGGGGGMAGKPDEVYLQLADGTRRSLVGQWRFRPAAVTVVPTSQDQLTPTLLYNAMLHPLIGYPLRGVVWYQGETNASASNALRYRGQFKALIESWRAQWGRPDLPFFWVQLPNFKAGEDTATESPWAELRESQAAALSLPHTGQAVIIDLGESDNIHPTDKQDVGHRLALVARRVTFGDKLVDAGPLYRGMRVDGSHAVLSFDTQGEPLAVRGGGQDVHGFELAGANGRYHPAQARIEGTTVVAVSNAVGHPASVRYAWSEDPVAANLVNRDGLPAAPFRSRER
ncbi:9-O-acetylesterase [Rhodanobacter sp. C06]|uniref:sialate O-acetylesterase n=1 Tax=Rhodanobacter sp. C06 TaxID=1945854 RepID=UPI000984D697|nr:sialate O-acetylesterase [Rhodanobacter sp. C06]OOG48314.1 9-O-acetylesterase [Rhodanobacter sp. C06]